MSEHLHDGSSDVDVVVVGSGVAGLAAALTAARRGRRVLLATKTVLASGSSPLAQGGLAAAVGTDDQPALHAADTERVGRGLCDHEIVRLLTEAAPREVAGLLDEGARLDRDVDGRLALGREAGHGRARIVHAGGDQTGAELVRALIAAVRREPAVEIYEDAFTSELLVCGGAAVGVLIEEDEPGRAREIRARAVVLATGGAGQLYLRTTNPPEATGDGVAMAARAGALLADLEMVQFHPTALAAASSAAPLPLLSEALRGAGALLVDDVGRRFLAGVHPDAELAPRDVVARELWQRAARGEASRLDLRPLAQGPPDLAARFPAAARACAAAGLDPVRAPVPVTPAAHYLIGGVWTDQRGRTSVPGLWACGEVAATGAHGANRLASNSLLEALVFGRRVGEDVDRAARRALLAAAAPAGAGELRCGSSRVPRLLRPAAAAPVAAAVLRERLQTAMWRGAGVVRSEHGLLELLAELDDLAATPVAAASSREAGELRNLIEVGRLVAAAALQRRESRGCHSRADHPEARPEYAARASYLAADLLDPTRRWPVAAPRAAATGRA